jgi:mannose-6-phosphate isomerase-like protein (cupin superfamily)
VTPVIRVTGVRSTLKRNRRNAGCKVTLAQETGQLTEFWSQHVVAKANGNLYKVAKGLGASRRHRHDDQDETFIVLSGTITIQLADGDVDLQPGDRFVVPRGVQHRAVARDEAHFLLIGPQITSTDEGGKPEWSHTAERP